MAEQALMVDVAGAARPVRIRRNAQARKMILRVDGQTGEVKVTAPPYVPARELERFVDQNRAWIEQEQAKVLSVPPVGHGSLVPFEGAEHQLSFLDEPPRRVLVEPGQISVGGPADQAPARLERWFRARARDVLEADAHNFADQLSTRFERISIGDMKSRWGSCSSSGTLRFNWRLVLAPPEVRRYVAAHEVAHLLEMNHSDRFWAHVAVCVPDHKERRAWLRREGAALMRLRFKTPQTGG